MCDAARFFGVPVPYDPAGEVAAAELLALIGHLVRHPNIHTDSSGVRRYDLLQQAARRAGPHKVLFGSDGPWLHPRLELCKIHLLGLPPLDAALITGGNFLRLAGLA